MQMTAAQFLAKKKRPKYGATRTKRSGINFHSKREAAFYDKLVNDQKEGKINFFLMQVPFQLPGNTKYLLDFMTFRTAHHVNYLVEYIDVKGFMTPVSKIKIAQVEEIYGVKIQIVK